MMETLDEYMPKSVKYTRPEGGLFVWLTLPATVPLSDFVKKALDRKVAVVPGTAFATDSDAYTANSFRVTYATPTDEQLIRGVGILADLMREMLVG